MYVPRGADGDLVGCAKFAIADAKLIVLQSLIGLDELPRAWPIRHQPNR
jgi:hypothetical protein